MAEPTDARGARAAISPEMRERLRWALEARGLTQRALARAAGIGENALGYILDGRVVNPSSASLLAILAALRLGAQWLVVGEGEPFADGATSGTRPAVSDAPLEAWLSVHGERLRVTADERAWLRAYQWPGEMTGALSADAFEATLGHYRLLQKLIRA